MDDRSLIDRIATVTRPTCAQCGDTLPEGCPSDDFCSQAHQQQWTEHHNDVQRLVGYREAANAISDSMSVREGTVGGGGDAGDVVRALAAAFASQPGARATVPDDAPAELRHAVEQFNADMDRIQRNHEQFEANIAEHKRRSKKRMWIALTVTVGALAVSQLVTWFGPPGWGWIFTVGQIVATVLALSWQTVGGRRDTRELLPQSKATS